ncbi:hypothetical protein OsJ_12559 [Oryza sativa Japonica Group]|uniref:SMP domain-containing protein n=1 Tax=Oryza sativa subsp. japonica TaxID=39947 RepID=A3AMN5_ORYSJ|nr:hypothetical protein OsJ_12559 [Oryza sativa Japonica Group]
MSQGQPRRPPPDGSGARPVMYGDVFDVSGELAGQPVAPRDAAKLQSAEEAGARGKLPADKAATREDAERVPSAEVRNRPDMATTPGGVADAVTAAARLNQERPTRSF